MVFLSWHERYSVGSAEIDAQHKALFDLVNRFDDTMQTGMTAESVGIMDDLISSTIEHFKFEEDLMAQVAFPQLPGHKQMHGELIKQVREMRAKVKAGGYVSTKSIVRFLADWLTNHIIREDLGYKPYLKG